MDRRRRNIKREKERKVERIKVKIQNILKVSAGQRRWRRLASREKKQCYKHEIYSSEKRQKKKLI